MSLGDECSNFSARIKRLYLSGDDEFAERKAAELLVRLVDGFRILFDQKIGPHDLQSDLNNITASDVEALSRRQSR